MPKMPGEPVDTPIPGEPVDFMPGEPVDLPTPGRVWRRPDLEAQPAIVPTPWWKREEELVTEPPLRIEPTPRPEEPMTLREMEEAFRSFMTETAKEEVEHPLRTLALWFGAPAVAGMGARALGRLPFRTAVRKIPKFAPAQYLPRGPRRIPGPGIYERRVIEPLERAAETRAARAAMVVPAKEIIARREAARVARGERASELSVAAQARDRMVRVNVEEQRLMAQGEAQRKAIMTRALKRGLSKEEAERQVSLAGFRTMEKVAIEDKRLGDEAIRLTKVARMKFKSPESIIREAKNQDFSDRHHWWNWSTSWARPSTELTRRMGKPGEEIAERYGEGIVTGMVRSGRTNSLLSEMYTKFTPEQTAEFVNAMDKGIVARTPVVKRAVAVTRALTEQIRKEAHELGIKVRLPGGKKVPIPERPEGYFPHMYDYEALLRSRGIGSVREKAIADIQKQALKEEGVRLNSTQAAQRLDRFVEMRARPYGHLERPRGTDLPGYITDPLVAYQRYFFNAYQRLETARQLGANNEIAARFIDMMPREGQRRLAKSALETMTGMGAGGEVKETAMLMTNRLTDFLTRRMMALSVISNVDQGIYGALTRTNMKATLKAASEAFTAPGKAWAKEAGVIHDAFAGEFVRFAKTRDALRKYGFTGTENHNRVVAALSAKHYLNPILGTLKKNPAHPQILREFARLRLDPKKVLKRGYFTRDEIQKSAVRIVHETQFRFAPAEMPFLYSSPLGKFMYHLKSFDLGWFRYVRTYVMAEARRGNLMPLVKLVGYGQMGGEAKADMWAFISGRERKPGALNRMLENFSYASSLGILSEAMRPGVWGDTAVERVFTPPGIGFAGEAEKGIRGVTRGSLEPSFQFVLRRVIVPSVALRGGFPAAAATRWVGERFGRVLP